MLAQRVAQQSLRRLAAQQYAPRLATPAAVATGNAMQMQLRGAATATTISGKAEQEHILAQQRLNRPNSPHLTIYRPQITWYLSIFNRITGSVLSGGFYVFGTAYLLAPYLGMHMESAAMAASIAAWPFAVKFLTKASLGFFFTFHSFNGVRHLIWDTARMISNKKVNQSGWTVIGLSAVSALALALM